ncbi:uncharacterized protein DDB_G0271670-like [Sabethes cyaneus]|uniref:uncharacterized protein DDB_G0271670-like n=1 Tax=Sabethes cyaneus TaxID=53552 RepID=UPI00237DA7B9|nr:uncharacterized protein DDB_G0271670-like [Sabethes cyaneus]
MNSPLERWLLVTGVIISFSACILTEDVSCSRIDFDQATLTYLSRCSYTQEFTVKQYSATTVFTPYRDYAEYYLSEEWQGLTCGETVQSFSVNEQTELRMVYNLVFDFGASLEVRVLDLDRIDSEGNPMVVIRWKTEQATRGWGLFREKMDKTVKRAKIQIEANMNSGSDVAIEYFTVFNYEVETDECNSIDEFATTTILPTTSTTSASSTTITTTTSTTSTTVMLTTTTASESSSSSPFTTTAVTTPSVHPTTRSSSSSTSSTATTNMFTSSTAEQTLETDISTSKLTTLGSTTNSPRYESTSTVSQLITSTLDPPVTEDLLTVAGATDWIWIGLAAVFAFLFCLATVSAVYIYAMNRNLQRIGLQIKMRHKGESSCTKNRLPYKVHNSS